MARPFIPLDIRDPLLSRAYVFAAEAHAIHLRTGSGLPYIVHPLAVMRIVRDHAAAPTVAQLAAALLHDTYEDTGASLEDIDREFGSEIADLVKWLSDVSKPSDGNRAARKKIDRDHSFRAPAAAQTVKMADLIANYRDVVVFMPDFARQYYWEKSLLVAGLDKADPNLRTIAEEILRSSPYAKMPPPSRMRSVLP